MRKARKALALLLAVCLLYIGLPFLQSTAAGLTTGGQCGENATWSLDETSGVLIISGTGAMQDGAIFNAANSEEYSLAQKVKSAYVSQGITRLGNGAFSNCVNMKTVSVPDSVAAVGLNSFRNCQKLTDVYYGGTIAQWSAMEIDTFGGGSVFQEPPAEPTLAPAPTPTPTAKPTNKPDVQPIPEPEEKGLPFTDISESDWHYSAVKLAYEQGLMFGTGEVRFTPNQPLTRGMAVTVLYRMAGKPEANTAVPFTDLRNGSYYEKAVRWAYHNGIAAGRTGTGFAPNEPITRQELAILLYHYSGDSAEQNPLAAFRDNGKVSAYARPALCWAVKSEIIFGKGSGILDPLGPATRAEAASMLMRYWRLAQ